MCCFLTNSCFDTVWAVGKPFLDQLGNWVSISVIYAGALLTYRIVTWDERLRSRLECSGDDGCQVQDIRWQVKTLQ